MTDAAKINYTSGNLTLNESDALNPTCVADGNPTPNITWTRVSNNKAVSFPLIISGKQDEGGYRCTASNDVRSPDSRIVVVFVQSKLILNCLPLPFIAWGYTELQNLSAGNFTQLFYYLN